MSQAIESTTTNVVALQRPRAKVRDEAWVPPTPAEIQMMVLSAVIASMSKKQIARAGKMLDKITFSDDGRPARECYIAAKARDIVVGR